MIDFGKDGFMSQLHYYWVNVFTQEQNKGNVLPVFLLDEPLSDVSMQEIATMFNQSETIFILSDALQNFNARIFTPKHELPFAGHPIIGSSAVLGNLYPNKEQLKLKVPAGEVDIKLSSANHLVWLKTPKPPQSRESGVSIEVAATMLGLPIEQIVSEPIWVNVGSEQLLIEVSDEAAVDAINIDVNLMKKHACLYPGREIIYIWTQANNEAYVRFMYLQNGILLEDVGTGSACANLGGLQVLRGVRGFNWTLRQGCLAGRENILFLQVNEQDEIWIGGQSCLMGEGWLNWIDNY